MGYHKQSPVDQLKCIEGTYVIQEFIKNYEEYPDIELRFLPEEMKNGKLENCICNLNTKVKYVLHIQNLKEVLNYELKLEVLNYELKLEKVHRVSKFNQKSG